MGSPQVINCRVTQISKVEPESGIIIWMGPNGDIARNSSRTMIMDTYNFNDNTYRSNVQFTYLMEGDNGTYTCNFIAREISVSQSVELQPLISKLLFTNYLYIWGNNNSIIH